MAACLICGARNPARARFCLDCGARIEQPGSDHGVESRRTVTVLFADVVGSTSLGESLDPEAVRAAIGRAFDAMRSPIERHGGTVEKFVGDAVMAIFGLPRLHDDDAIRAVRAAAELRDAVATLSDELVGRLGRPLAVRIGVNTGEVVAGDPGSRATLATGDAVNTAARLEQAATPGEILVGPVTARLVRGAAILEPVEPIHAKGKAQPVPAFRLTAIEAAPASGRWISDIPFVGREAELARLRTAFDAVVRDRDRAIITVLGPPGVGKSRLVAELVAGIGPDARVLRGRCLPYGDGLTYWPLRELVLSAAGLSGSEGPQAVTERLRALVGDGSDRQAIADRLATAIGSREGAASAVEIAWAARRTFERLAAERPLVLLVEDIHWAHQPMLELLEHVASDATRGPILILCPARTELLETVPTWGGGPHAFTLELEGLDAATGERLIEATAAGTTLPTALRERILETAEGNPLFVEETVRLLLETGDLSLAIPPTIQALMATRVDHLPVAERAVAQRGAVVGRVFERTAVEALLPDVGRRGVGSRLQGLVRKQLLRRDGGSGPGARAFKFRHILIRDAAYDALPKLERAELHEAFARWLAGTVAGSSREHPEVLGYHLEQAYRYRTELRQVGERTEDLGRQAARHLAEAARQTLDRGDVTAADRLYERAAGLPGWDDGERAELSLRWGLALVGAAENERSIERIGDALAIARVLGDLRLAARARLARVEAFVNSGAYVNPSDEVRDEVDRALADATASGDDRAIAEALASRSTYTYLTGDLGGSLRELDGALEHALRTGDERLVLEMEQARLAIALVGPTPATQVVAMAEGLLARCDAYPSARADALRLVAPAEGMLGRHDDARRHAAQSLAIVVDLGRRWEAALVRLDVSWVQRLAGDLTGAEQVLRDALADIDSFGDQTTRAFGASRLAVVLVAQGRFDDARPFVAEGETVPSVTNRSRVLGARARIRAAAGDADGALADVALMLEPLADTWFINVLTDAVVDAAEVAATLGHRATAVRYFNEALALAERKENVVLAELVRRRIADQAT